MKEDLIEKVINLFDRVGYLFIVTASNKGIPHLATSEKITIIDSNKVSAESWYCPRTVENLKENKYVSLVIWDYKEDIGYQLLGELEKIEDMAMLNGFSPEIDTKVKLPQVERKLIIKIDKVIEFKHAPHSDLEI